MSDNRIGTEARDAMLAIAIKATAFAIIEAGSISFFLWTSYFLAHIIAGAA